MCGIAGVFGQRVEDLAPVGAMTTALRHRGPDDEGYLLADSSTGRIGSFRGRGTIAAIHDPPLPAVPPAGTDLAFGHRRLSIIDLSPGGHGPMSTADGRVSITYNGEIYNYLELRRELQAHGHSFRTASDTEVLLAAYVEWGTDCLHHLNGMWAFALYDAREKILFCARDRFGVKPFHYFWDDGFFAFASEIKGLVVHPRVPCRPSARMIRGFLLEGSLDEGEDTFFDGIRALRAGHRVVLHLPSRRLNVERWYTLPEPSERSLSAAELGGLLEDAVRLRLRSDVDVGTCLSGGLDSSSIVAFTARQREAAAGGRHRSFSVLYDDPGFDESPFVTAVAESNGVASERVTPTSADLVRDLPALVRHQDEPFPSAGPYSQWRVMALAHAAGVKVLLDGQGADEVLAGYHYHFGPYFAEQARRHGIGTAFGAARDVEQVTGHRLPFLLGLLAYHALPAPASFRSWAVRRWASHGRVPSALLPPAAEDKDRVVSLRHLPRRSLLEERRAGILSTSLPALLRYEDRSSMAFGIEARTPFLDYRLVEASLALPASDLIREGWTKHILREAMTGLLPEAVRMRRDKLGFATPEGRWLIEIAPQVRQWLGRESRVAPMLRDDALAEWLGGSDAELGRRPGLFRLLSLELWLRYAQDEVGR